MTNRLVKTAHVLYTPAIPEVVGIPARCVPTAVSQPGLSNTGVLNPSFGMKNGYWLSGGGSAVYYGTPRDRTTHAYWWVSYRTERYIGVIG